MSVAIDTQDTERMEVGPIDLPKEINIVSDKDREKELPGSYKISGPEQKDVRKIRNAILLVFIIAIKAQKPLKEGHKQTKLDNSALEKRCKELNGRVSTVCKTARDSSTKYNYGNVIIPVIVVASNLSANWAAQQHFNWWQGRVQNCRSFADHINWIPYVGGTANAIPGAALSIQMNSRKQKTDQLTGYVSTFNQFAQMGLQGITKNVDTTMQMERAPLDAAYQASNSLYQARVQDESSDKQAVDGTRRTIEEAMRQEEKLFEGALGKG